MTVTDTTITDNDMLENDQMAAELVKRLAAIEADKERCDEIKATLRVRLPVGRHDTGSHTVLIKAGARRLNARRLTEAFPAAQYPGLYKATLDTTAVKAEFAPVALAEYQDEGTPVVEVK